MTDEILRKDRKYLWHPFTQSKVSKDPIVIESAKGEKLFDSEGNEIVKISGIVLTMNHVGNASTVPFISTVQNEIFFTFIGTGLSVRAPSSTSNFTPIAQNLPYGTHVLEVFRDSSATPIKLDGVEISASYTNLHSIRITTEIILELN